MRGTGRKEAINRHMYFLDFPDSCGLGVEGCFLVIRGRGGGYMPYVF